MNSFLRTGQKSSGDNSSIKGDTEQNGPDDDIQMEIENASAGGESSALAESKMITSNQPKISIDINNVLKVIETSENGIESGGANDSGIDNAQPETSDTKTNSCNTKSKGESNKRGMISGPDPTKPLQPKAKVLRQQRKAAKLLAKGEDAAEVATVKKESKNLEKNLKSLIDEAPADGKHKLKAWYHYFVLIFSLNLFSNYFYFFLPIHLVIIVIFSVNFQVKLVPSHAASTEAALNLYRRYQVGIHKDPPEKITRKSFENFLVRSPLQVINQMSISLSFLYLFIIRCASLWII